MTQWIPLVLLAAIPAACWWTWFLSRRADRPLRDVVDLMARINGTVCDATERQEARGAELQIQIIRAIGDLSARQRPARRLPQVQASSEQSGSGDGRLERLAQERAGLEPVGREDVAN